jgi:putative ABC transport system permease protein
MSVKNILQNKIRSFLTILGIVIGVSSIIALITIVQGATGSITDEISSLGADKITVQVPGTYLKSGLSTTDLDNFEKVDYVRGISPTISGKQSVLYKNKFVEDISIMGKNEVYFNENTDILSSGRGINIKDIEFQTQVAIIGNDLAEELFPGINPIGEEILIGNRTFTVIGMLNSSSGFSINSTNESIIIPYTSAMKSLGIRNINNLDIYMFDSSKSDQIIESINQILNISFNYNEDAFSVYNMEDMIDAISSVTDTMSLILIGIASISLLVGGIGIMNMMLVSVTERTTEIGLRKALGAEPKRIQLQFLIESIVLSSFGGIIGLFTGGIIAFAASIFIDFQFNLTIGTTLLAIGFSSIVGIVFGLAPASKASKLNPIDALRHV